MPDSVLLVPDTRITLYAFVQNNGTLNKDAFWHDSLSDPRGKFNLEEVLPGVGEHAGELVMTKEVYSSDNLLFKYRQSFVDTVKFIISLRRK